MAERFTNPVTQYNDDGGDLVPAARLVFFETGTTTAKDVFADADLKTSLGNIVNLDGAGRVPNIWLDGSYKVRLHEFSGNPNPAFELGTQLWERDPVGGDTTSAVGGDWVSTVLYGIEEIVKGSDGNYYISIIASNQNNDPVSIPGAWSKLNWFTDWNTSQTYSAKDNVKGSDGIIYYSVTGSNLGNDPTLDTTGTNWLTASSVSTDLLKGTALKSTQAKTDAGTDDDSYITPLQLASKPVPTFRGALVYDNKSTAITTGVSVGMTWELESYDTDSIHDTVTNQGRLTVPAGVSKVKVYGEILWLNTASGTYRDIQIRKNGSASVFIGHGKSQVGIGAAALQKGQYVTTAIIDVTPGDYFELWVFADYTGTGPSSSGIAGSNWFAMEIVE